MYKGDKVVLAKNKADHDRLNKLGYTHDNPKTKKVEEACWDGYKQKGMKKKGDKVVPNCVKETDLGVMIAKAQSDRIKRDWNKKSQSEKLDSLKKDRAELKKRMSEGENHSWRTDGHYKKDGTEYTGDQHAHDGQVMTGKTHTKDSENLYHFKDLSPEVKKKVLERMKMDEGLVDKIMKSKTLNKRNYAYAAKELEKRMKKDPSKTKQSHAHDVASYVRNVDARKLTAEEIDMTGCPLLEKLNPSMGIKKYINDFYKSDAPQFRGASKAKRRKMAVAAYLGAKRDE